MERMNPFAAPLASWYETSARDLPWRRPSATPWGILVSEIMLQQTPAARVIPYWETWMRLWPAPADLAEATTAEVIQSWGTLGYPRRALRLRECATTITNLYGQVPENEADLRSLPGIGDYTSAAISAFAYGKRTVVLDTNIRRVISRAHLGEALPPPHLTTTERAMAAHLVPEDPAESVTWNQSTMELGAVICKAREATCDSCPIINLCEWRKANYPADLHAGQRRPQPWEGTDRQARGRIMSYLREAEGELVPIAAILAATPREAQTQRAIKALVTDGLAHQEGEALRLP